MGLASQKPPSAPRWAADQPVWRNWVRMVSMNLPGMSCAWASCSPVTWLPDAAAGSSIAARSA